jgi:DNA primase
MRYPQTFIDDLRRQTDIVRVIQDYVPLKKKGANWMACCPFHKEKTPSFSVSPAKEIFYCFGCHKGGSVFNFVMETEGVSFPEAIKIVAEKSGVPLPKMIDEGRFEAKRQEADEVIELNKWALEWWEQQLEHGGAEARVAREYLTKREITDETRKTFQLGYAPDSWEALSIYLRQKGATQAQIERSGLVVKKEEGGSYDRFRGRLMFPVMDVQGRPIAFGGRSLNKDDLAKYLNSPETAAYVKGRHLFGLNLTRDEIRKEGQAILVEGYLDLIIPYQFGLRNVVASLGTALTPEQAKLLGRFVRKVMLNYDGDKAGVKASKKAIEILLAENLQVTVSVLPDADPDEFIRSEGASHYRHRRTLELNQVRHAPILEQEGKELHWTRFLVEEAIRDASVSGGGKREAWELIRVQVSGVHDRIQQREFFDIAMKMIRIDDPALISQLWRSVNVARFGKPDNLTTDRGVFEVRLTVAEQQLLQLLFRHKELRSVLLPQLDPRCYEELSSAALFRALIELERTDRLVDFEGLWQELAGDPHATDLLARLWVSEGESLDDEMQDPMMLAERFVAPLRLKVVERDLVALNAQINDAFEAGSKDALERLEAERKRLEKERRRFFFPEASS